MKKQSEIYEQYKLFNRSQETGETLEACHAALTAQAAPAELWTPEDELVRDLFISKMKNTVQQDTLTFETFPPDEVLKRALTFEKSKQTKQVFQKSNASTASAGKLNGAQMKIKQVPIMAIGNKGPNKKRYYREQCKRKTNETKSNVRSGNARKPRTRCGRAFVDGCLKNCSAMGMNRKNCNKPNHFAKMCRSQQVKELTEKTTSSDEECNLIQSFDSCHNSEIISIEYNFTSIVKIENYLGNRKESKQAIPAKVNENRNVKKIKTSRNPKSQQKKTLKALIRIHNQIINMTIDTGSPVSFLIWAMAKQILEASKNKTFIQIEKLNLSA